jgi:hypothetical protein
MSDDLYSKGRSGEAPSWFPPRCDYRVTKYTYLWQDGSFSYRLEVYPTQARELAEM